MNDKPTDSATRPKRTDVGYKRPPVEHQFKPGHKPPARKKQPAPQTVRQTLMMILREEVRVERGGKPQWMTNAALLVEVAFQLAEKGNPTLSRALLDYQMAGEIPPNMNNEPICLTDPDNERAGTYHFTRKAPL